MATQASNYGSALADAVVDGIAILAIGAFLGSNPRFYRSGVLQLVPENRRTAATDLLDDVASTVQGWLLGQLIPMSVLGIGILVGLWVLRIPLAFTLALFTALMLFIPYAGSVLAYIPTALIAWTQGPMKVVYVTVVYLGVHIAEGYIITPLAQRHAVRLPPRVTLFSQLFMWKLAGFLGVMLATPLAAVVLVIVQKLYLKREPSLKG